MEINRDRIILDARTAKSDKETIMQKNIVSGILSQSGLEKISNILQGSGQPLKKARGNGKPELLQLPKEDRSVTKFMPGNLAYADTQNKRRS